MCVYTGPCSGRPGRPRRRRRERPRCERGAPACRRAPRIAAPPRPVAGSRAAKTAEWLRGIIEPLETLVNKKMRLKTREHPREQVRCATLLSTALPLERGSNSAMERAGRSSVHRNQEPHRGRAGSQVKRHRPSPSLTVPIEHSDTAARTLLSTRSSVRQQAIGKRYSSTGPPGG